MYNVLFVLSSGLRWFIRVWTARQASSYHNPLLIYEIIGGLIPDFNIYFPEELQCTSYESK